MLVWQFVVHADRTSTVLLHVHFISTEDFASFEWKNRAYHAFWSRVQGFIHLCSGVCCTIHKITNSFLQLLPSVFFFISLIWQWKIIWNCRLSSISLDSVICYLGIVDLCVLIMFSHLIAFLRQYLFSSRIDFLGDISEPRNNAYYGDGQPRSINIVGGHQKQAM